VEKSINFKCFIVPKNPRGTPSDVAAEHMSDHAELFLSQVWESSDESSNATCYANQNMSGFIGVSISMVEHW